MLLNQIDQLKNNLRQARQNINSTLGQINQQLANSEQIAQSIGNQFVQQTGASFGSQYGTTQYGGSQYQPFQNTGISGGGEYQDQASMIKKGGVNQYGANYSSGIRDEDVGQAYYQSQGTQFGVAKSQYNPQHQATMLGGGGVNQYGAQYRSGNRDEDIGQSYYQSK